MALLAAAGCGPSAREPVAPTAAASAEAREPPAGPRAAENRPPRIQAVRLDPELPVPGGRLRALVSASDAEDDPLWFEYAWQIDGREAGEKGQGRDLDLSAAAKGQTVELVVVASDGRSRSRPFDLRVELENRAPEIVEVGLKPGREVIAGAPVVALVSATDPDGDRLDYRYQWTVNGRVLREKGALLETKRMRRGDEIRLRVVASDGEADSPAVEMDPILVVNRPPRVVSIPPAAPANGVFRYAVVAEDPDGDSVLEYRLEGAPSGMRIHPHSGLVTWAPSPEQTGMHTVTVVAADLYEGVGEQVFEVRVSPPGGEAFPAEIAP